MSIHSTPSVDGVDYLLLSTFSLATSLFSVALAATEILSAKC